MTTPWLDLVPSWALFLMTVGGFLLAYEAGFRLARYRGRSLVEEAASSQLGGTLGAVLGLLAFLLAFTFGLAGARFADRKGLVVEEANAIGTAYLRAQVLPEPQGASARALFREYVEVRLGAVRSGDLGEVQLSIARSEEIQGQLWAQAVYLGKKNPNSVMLGLYVRALNDVIDLHSRRVAAGLRDRIPDTIWWALYFVAITGLVLMGYQAGLNNSRTPIATAALVLTFSAVLLMIIDLDRPHQNLFAVSQQAMLDLRSSLSKPEQ